MKAIEKLLKVKEDKYVYLNSADKMEILTLLQQNMRNRFYLNPSLTAYENKESLALKLDKKLANAISKESHR